MSRLVLNKLSKRDIKDALKDKHVHWKQNIGPRMNYTNETIKVKGSNVRLLGYSPDWFTSGEWILDKLDAVRPKLLIWSGINPWSIYKYQKGWDYYQKPPPLNYKPDDIFMKSKLTRYFRSEYHKNLFLYDNPLGVFYKTIEGKRCNADIPMSVAYWGKQQPGCAIVAGSRPRLIEHLELAQSLSVEELRHIFDETMREVKDKSKAIGLDPAATTHGFRKRTQGVSTELFYKELHGLRYKYILDLIMDLATEYRDMTVTLHMQVAPLLPMINKEPLPETDLREDPWYETLEKLVIISYLDHHELQSFFERDVNPLPTLGPSNDEVKTVYNTLKDYYQSKVDETRTAEIARIVDMSSRGRIHLPLSSKLKEIEGRTGEINFGIVHKHIQDSYKSSMLLVQIDQNIKRKMNAGLSQTKEIQALQQLGDNEPTAHNMRLLEKLVVEANAQLRVTKMPEHLKNLENMVQYDVSVNEIGGFNYMKDPERLDEDVDAYINDPDNPYKPAGARDKQLASILLGNPNMDVKGKSEEELLAEGFSKIADVEVEHDKKGAPRALWNRQDKQKIMDKFNELGYLKEDDLN